MPSIEEKRDYSKGVEELEDCIKGVEEFEDYIKIGGHRIYADRELRKTILSRNGSCVVQFQNVLAIPGLLGAVGMPDMHAGVAFPVGTVAAVDLSSENACVCPEGVGGDINCGVRCLRSNLFISDIQDHLNELADLINNAIPAGVGNACSQTITLTELNEILAKGMKYLYDKGEIPLEDLKYTESNGSAEGDSRLVYQSAKGKGLNQLGSLGSGNHYIEVQVVDKICNQILADKLHLKKDQIMISIHTGSRGLGNAICTNFVQECKDSKDLVVSDGCLKFLRFNSELGMKYTKLMNSACNYAWVNRSVITNKVREAFKKLWSGSRVDNVYDAGHNIAKIEEIKGKVLLVHRKGASRILPPGHPDLPEDYQSIGQPVLVGGSMGTNSYLIAGAPGCTESFNSSCHGSGRLLTRGEARRTLEYENVAKSLGERGIIFRSGSESGLVEEAPECYKDVHRVVASSENAGLSTTVVLLRPVLVIKG